MSVRRLGSVARYARVVSMTWCAARGSGKGGTVCTCRAVASGCGAHPAPRAGAWPLVLLQLYSRFGHCHCCYGRRGHRGNCWLRG